AAYTGGWMPVFCRVEKIAGARDRRTDDEAHCSNRCPIPRGWRLQGAISSIYTRHQPQALVRQKRRHSGDSLSLARASVRYKRVELRRRFLDLVLANNLAPEEPQ